ncbi:MAG: hypothetical protein AB7V04_10190 [Desulfomonilaceae bacterium]
MYQISRDSTVKIVIWGQEPVSWVFALGGARTIGQAPNSQEEPDLGPCFWAGTGEDAGGGELDKNFAVTEKEKGLQ